MNKNLDIINFAVSLIIKVALIAARFSGRARKRSLKRLATMDINEKDKEILFLRDTVDQLKMQVSILQKGIKKKQKNPRYTLREKLFILWQMEIFQIPRRRVTEYFGIARSTLYRWLHKIEDQPTAVLQSCEYNTHGNSISDMGNNKIKRQLGANSDCKPAGDAEHLYLSLYCPQYP